MNNKKWFYHQTWWQTARFIYGRLRTMEIDLSSYVESAQQAVERMTETLEVLGVLFTGSTTLAFALADGAVLECDVSIEAQEAE